MITATTVTPIKALVLDRHWHSGVHEVSGVVAVSSPEIVLAVY